MNLSLNSNRMIIHSAHVRMRQSYYTYEERDAWARRWILRDISDAYLHSHNVLEITTGEDLNFFKFVKI